MPLSQSQGMMLPPQIGQLGNDRIPLEKTERRFVQSQARTAPTFSGTNFYLPRRNGNLDHGIRPETVSIRSVMLGVPVADCHALPRRESRSHAHPPSVQIANQVCDRMLVACATMLLKSCHGFCGPGNVIRLVYQFGVAPVTTITKRRDCSPQRRCRLQLPIEEKHRLRSAVASACRKTTVFSG
jgi:hypothetical protein